MAYRKNEVRIELNNFTNAGRGAYALSDGWSDSNNEEQFILFDKDGNQFGRFSEREILQFEKK